MIDVLLCILLILLLLLSSTVYLILLFGGKNYTALTPYEFIELIEKLVKKSN